MDPETGRRLRWPLPSSPCRGDIDLWATGGWCSLLWISHQVNEAWRDSFGCWGGGLLLVAVLSLSATITPQCDAAVPL